jgi:hypothetical protein
MRRANYQQLEIIQMEAKDYLKKIGITERVLNSEDLPEYWKSLSQLMEDYAALRQPLDSSSVCDCDNLHDGEIAINRVKHFKNLMVIWGKLTANSLIREQIVSLWSYQTSPSVSL